MRRGEEENLPFTDTDACSVGDTATMYYTASHYSALYYVAPVSRVFNVW